MATNGSAIEGDFLLPLAKDQVIAVIRVEDHHLGINLAQAAVRGGIKWIEVTWNSARADLLIQKLKILFPQCRIGTGTIFTHQALMEAIAVGVDFVFCPHVDQQLINQAQKLGLPIIPGASTPTEIVQAWQWGATAVKIFPIVPLGGTTYLRALQGPLGHIPLIPTGGVTPANGLALLQAGAMAIGLGTGIFPPELIHREDWDGITDRVCQLITQLGAN